jgi:hypothetical protein
METGHIHTKEGCTSFILLLALALFSLNSPLFCSSFTKKVTTGDGGTESFRIFMELDRQPTIKNKIYGRIDLFEAQ